MTCININGIFLHSIDFMKTSIFTFLTGFIDQRLIYALLYAKGYYFVDTRILIGAILFIVIVLIGLIVLVGRVLSRPSRRASFAEKEREPSSEPVAPLPAVSGRGEASISEYHSPVRGGTDWERDRNSWPEMPVVGYNEQKRVASPDYERFPPRTGVVTNDASAFRVQDARKRYERGMQVSYDENIDALAIIFTDVVMNTPADVSLAFDVVMEKMRSVMSLRGQEHCAWHADIAGLVIGGDATNVWGQTLKKCLDALCIKVQGGYYLAAHYNSRGARPSEEQIREKVKRIQFMTSAAINGFQSNIFDTREEAIAYLMRMRELSVRR